jgi:hypothetical protein
LIALTMGGNRTPRSRTGLYAIARYHGLKAKFAEQILI